MDIHRALVAEVAAKVRHFHDIQQPFRIYHGTTSSTRSTAFERTKIVDTSMLNHVLKVDSNSRIALVEPNVPMDRLVEATLKYGLLPPVVMEFPGITVGGGFAGQSGESSSFKHGLFDETVKSIEIVLACGDVVHASSEERPDLLTGAAR